LELDEFVVIPWYQRLVMSTRSWCSVKLHVDGGSRSRRRKIRNYRKILMLNNWAKGVRSKHVEKERRAYSKSHLTWAGRKIYFW
jgi:hypothetical protein